MLIFQEHYEVFSMWLMEESAKIWFCRSDVFDVEGLPANDHPEVPGTELRPGKLDLVEGEW